MIFHQGLHNVSVTLKQLQKLEFLISVDLFVLVFRNTSFFFFINIFFFYVLNLKYKNYSHDVGKPVRRVPKRKQMAQDSESQRRSALNVRLFLREFCIDFLENCYNRLMYLVKVNDGIHITETLSLSIWVGLSCVLFSEQEGLIRERAQQHDETYYLWALTFFMAFNRGQNFRPDVVSETMSIRTFHFIEKNITNYYEMILTDKSDATSWSRRLVL